MDKKTIVYYIVSPVHLRNVSLIAESMPEYQFVICYEADVETINSWFDDEKIDYPIIHLKGTDINEALWSYKPKAIIMSTIQNRPLPLILSYEARKRNVPTIAIEESIQMALNDGKVNNYMFPVDYVAFGSNYELEETRKLGLVSGKTKVTGWPFGQKTTIRSTDVSRLLHCKELGIDSDKKQVLLTFPGLYAGTETNDVRKAQLRIGSDLLKLNPDIQLLVKPHPVESREKLENWILELFQETKDRVILFDGSVSIDRLIQASDFMLNRGASQTFFEALLQNVPVIFLDVGVKCQFFDYSRNAVFSNAEKVNDFMKRYKSIDFSNYYRALLNRYLPFKPEEALVLVTAFINESITKGVTPIKNFGEIQCMAFLYRNLHEKAKECASTFEIREEAKNKLERLANFQTLDFDEWKILLNEWKRTFYYNFIFSLFIRDVVNKKLLNSLPVNWIDWANIFPTKVHSTWFSWGVEKTLTALKSSPIKLRRYLEKFDYLKVRKSKV